MLHIRGLEMLSFRKNLRTYLMDDLVVETEKHHINYMTLVAQIFRVYLRLVLYLLSIKTLQLSV